MSRRRHCLLLVSVLIGLPLTAVAAELSEAASQAYAEYVERARQSFVDRLNQGWSANDADRADLLEQRVIGRPAGGDGILDVPQALVHHWRGTVYIPGVTLDQVLSVSHAYRDYPGIFRTIVAARVLSEDGDAVRVEFRMRESAAGMTATLDMRSSIHYVRVDAKRAYGISSAEDIREVKDAGRPNERQLPAGRDSGYLWRAGTFTLFVEADDGVYMEMETVGLSRRFPRLLGWLIEPIARRVGRRSAEDSVQQFRRAVLTRYSSEPPR